jgi:hypothetical protein
MHAFPKRAATGTSHSHEQCRARDHAGHTPSRPAAGRTMRSGDYYLPRRGACGPAFAWLHDSGHCPGCAVPRDLPVQRTSTRACLASGLPGVKRQHDVIYRPEQQSVHKALDPPADCLPEPKCTGSLRQPSSLWAMIRSVFSGRGNATSRVLPSPTGSGSSRAVCSHSW